MMQTRLQYISQGKTVQEQTENIRSALDAGCRWIQLRFKNAENNELCELAVQVKKMCSEYRATFIMNDRVDIAKIADADGVHLGLSDTSIEGSSMKLRICRKRCNRTISPKLKKQLLQTLAM